MCFDTLKDNQMLDSGKDTETPSAASILSAGVGGAGSTLPAKQSGLSKAVNNPLTQGGAAAAGTALAPATMGLSLLIPVAAKIFGSLLGKKPPRSFAPPPNTDAGLTSIGNGTTPGGSYDLLNRFKSFGGM